MMESESAPLTPNWLSEGPTPRSNTFFAAVPSTVKLANIDSPEAIEASVDSFTNRGCVVLLTVSELDDVSTADEAVVTVIRPEVASAGTTAVICALETTVKDAASRPLNLTAVA